MNKGIKAFLGIVSASPILFLMGLTASFVLYSYYPIVITQSAQAADFLTALGGLLIVIGTSLAFASQRISRKVTDPKYKATCPDLMQGPYAYSRHPGSLSLIIMYLGFTLVVNSLIMLGLVLILGILLTFIFIPAQERIIAEMCPESYAEYKTKVRMWF